MNTTIVIPESVYIGYIMGFGGRTIRSIEDATNTQIRWPYKWNPSDRKFTIYGFGSRAATDIDKAADEILRLVNGCLASMELPPLEMDQLILSLTPDNAPERQAAPAAQKKQNDTSATMLPTEAFADAIAFLRLFDLGALAVTSATCSSLATKASTAIRWEDFSGLHFSFLSTRINVIRYSDGGPMDAGELVASLYFPHKAATAEFVAAALPNCIVGDVLISGFHNVLLFNAFDRVADSVVVKGTLRLPDVTMLDEYSLAFARKFRSVKILEFLQRKLSDDEVNEIANMFRGSGVRELHFYRPYIGSKAVEELSLLHDLLMPKSSFDL